MDENSCEHRITLRNLIAYEQCSFMHRYILSYATMFNQLINSTKDLDRLIQKGIIDTESSKEDTFSFLFFFVQKALQ